jgi:hypothetical protein
MAALLLLQNILNIWGMPNANNAPNNVAARFVLMHDITDVNDLAVFQPKDVSKMMKLWNMDVANNNKKLGMGIQKKVEALILWLANQHCCRLAIDMTTQTAQALMDASQGMAIHKNNEKSRESQNRVKLVYLGGKVRELPGSTHWKCNYATGLCSLT